VRRRCPAIILAASRTDKVIGRIILLIISINTIKGINGAGVPIGTRCARKSVMLLIILNIMKLTQKGRAKDKVMARWLVDVKVNENKPKVLLNKISKNKEINKIMFIFLFFKRVENSLFIEEIAFSSKIL
jgi:hypothetical protein